MKEIVDIENWNRKEHYLFFKDFEEPYHGVNVNIDCSKAYSYVKEHQCSFFLFYLHCALKAANLVENFKLRIEDGKLYKYSVINAGSTIGRDNGTFGFGYFFYNPVFFNFLSDALRVQADVKARTDLERDGRMDQIRCSPLPWIDFTSLSHARRFSFTDTCPKVSFGQMTIKDNKRTMPLSVHVHHALVDGIHLAQFIDVFQKAMNLEI